MDSDMELRKALLLQYRIGYRLRELPNEEYGHRSSCLILLNDAYLQLFLDSGLHAAIFIQLDQEIRRAYPVTADQTRLAISDAMTNGL